MQSLNVQKGFLTHLRLPDFVVAQIPGLAHHESDLAFKTILLNEIWIDEQGVWKPYRAPTAPDWVKHKTQMIVVEKEDHPGFPYEACGFISPDIHRLNAYFHVFKEAWAGHHSSQTLHDEICQCLKIK